MRRRALVWKLFPIYFLITLASVIVVSMFALRAQREFYYSQVEVHLTTKARMVSHWVAKQHRLTADRATLNTELGALDRCTGTRFTVLLPSGEVAADSEFEPGRMQNHRNRPEVAKALLGSVGSSRRLSRTLGVTMVYVATPILDRGKVVGVVRASVGATAIDAIPAALTNHVLFGTLLTALLAGAVSLLAARRISRPLARIRDAAAQLAQGDLDSRVRPPDTEELGSLADTLNIMAAQIGQQIRTITQQAHDQRAILSSMSECVIAIDNNDRVILLNPAAEVLLGVTLEQVQGRTIHESVRNPVLQRFFEDSYTSNDPTSTEITFHGTEDRIVQAVGTALVDSDSQKIGVLVVLNDVTHTRRLESIRRDFVANVSHELRTPVTSIRGFVETLRKGVGDPAKSDEFLEIVEKQATRLQTITEDLLMLAQLEQKSDVNSIPMEPTAVAGILTSALSLCKPQADAGRVSVTLACDEDVKAMANGPLLEQAISNLLDNAIKYAEGGSVHIAAEQLTGETAIRVADTGCGIEPEHIARLFERFYRVDKARSRKLGGTGLGLAIAKHIVQAHAGRIEVISTPGKGSTFTVFLPAGGPTVAPAQPV